MRLLETDTSSNTNVASATSVASYTADAAREVIARVLIDQAAGAGDYIVYAKVQRGGSGSSYVMLPKTTGTAASGETAIGFVSISLPVSTGDVVTIWVDGLAGDTTTPDIITDWYEVDTLRPTTADRTLDVSAGGEAGVDWANVGSPSTSVSLSGTTVATVTTTGTATNVTTVNGLASGVITAASIAADAIGASELAADAVAEIQSGLATASALTTAQTDLTTLLGRLSAARAGYLDNLSAGAVATASALSAVATSVGLTATAAKLLRYVQLTLRKDSAVATDLATELAEINANTGTGTGGYLSTTDSQEASRDAISAGSASAADIAAELGGMGYTVVDADSVTSTAISKRRGDVWTITLTDLGALGTWTKLWFTIKTGDTGDADTDAKVQILLTNPTAGTDGLQRLNGAAATAAQGSIVVDDSATGDITVTVASAATTQLAVRSDYVFDVQILRAAGTTTLAYGTFTVRSDVTRAVS